MSSLTSTRPEAPSTDDPTSSYQKSKPFSQRWTFFTAVSVAAFFGIVHVRTIISSSFIQGFLPTPNSKTSRTAIVAVSTVPQPVTVSGLRAGQHTRHTRAEENIHNQCRFYLAESAIPNSGLGLFTAVGLHPDDTIGFPDICIFVGDAPKKTTHMSSHTWGSGTFFLQYEGKHSRVACEGFASTYNTAPLHMVNTRIVTPPLPTTAGLHRTSEPGAGAISHHYGISSVALDVITAGSELTIDYGDWDFDEKTEKTFTKPARSVGELREKGWCIDNIDIRQATDPTMGRGAFAVRFLEAGSAVAPAPLQVFKNREIFKKADSEQLYVNYCFQAPDSKMLFFPYGPAVNLINHADIEKANVHLRWSNNSLHHAEWLDMSIHKFWTVAYPGGLVLEVVATRNIEPGEELFMYYGKEWQEAWERHVETWKPWDSSNSTYEYPEELDETEELKTIYEQAEDPYPENIGMMCNTPHWSNHRKGKNMTWEEPQWEWWEGMTRCHVLSREMGKSGDYVYTVALNYSRKNFDYTATDLPDASELFIDENVPRKAIRFVELPYTDDEHLPGAFRHTIELPAHLFPPQWRNFND